MLVMVNVSFIQNIINLKTIEGIQKTWFIVLPLTNCGNSDESLYFLQTQLYEMKRMR